MQITLLKEEADPQTHTEAQVNLFDFIKERFTQVSRISTREMMKAMGCSIPQPILCRLKHLEEKGTIALSECP